MSVYAMVGEMMGEAMAKEQDYRFDALMHTMVMRWFRQAWGRALIRVLRGYVEGERP